MIRIAAFTVLLCIAVQALPNGRQYNVQLLHPPAFKGADPERDVIATEWMDQALDHFNTSETRRWKQRYMTNRRFYATGGPAFLQFGGEGAISDNFLQTCE